MRETHWSPVSILFPQACFRAEASHRIMGKTGRATYFLSLCLGQEEEEIELGCECSCDSLVLSLSTLHTISPHSPFNFCCNVEMLRILCQQLLTSLLNVLCLINPLSPEISPSYSHMLHCPSKVLHTRLVFTLGGELSLLLSLELSLKPPKTT